MMQRGEVQTPSLGPKWLCSTGFESEDDDDGDDEDAIGDGCWESGHDDGDDTDGDDEEDDDDDYEIRASRSRA